MPQSPRLYSGSHEPMCHPRLCRQACPPHRATAIGQSFACRTIVAMVCLQGDVLYRFFVEALAYMRSVTKEQERISCRRRHRSERPGTQGGFARNAPRRARHPPIDRVASATTRSRCAPPRATRSRCAPAGRRRLAESGGGQWQEPVDAPPQGLPPIAPWPGGCLTGSAGTLAGDSSGEARSMIDRGALPRLGAHGMPRGPKRHMIHLPPSVNLVVCAVRRFASRSACSVVCRAFRCRSGADTAR